jgi:hypothetical protein
MEIKIQTSEDLNRLLEALENPQLSTFISQLFEKVVPRPGLEPGTN